MFVKFGKQCYQWNLNNEFYKECKVLKGDSINPVRIKSEDINTNTFYIQLSSRLNSECLFEMAVHENVDNTN